MLTALALPRLGEHHAATLTRAAAVTERSLVAVRHGSYWILVLSGFFEPVLYLLSIGIGVGALVGDFTLADGRVVSYATFVAPAMLAAAAMQGAIAEATFNFFAKLKWIRLYDAIIATPVRPVEIALGELGWALTRGALYSAGFLTLMVIMGLTSAGWALVTLPATVLVGFAFGGLGMAVATYLRTWQDFDYLVVAQFALFLFSGTFAPTDSYPIGLRILIQLTPLTQAVDLVRGLTTATPSLALLGHILYLAVLAAAGLLLAGRRMNGLLCR